MRCPIAALVVALVAPAVSVASRATPPRDVPCSESIQHTEFPFRSGGYRVVLGSIAVPPAYLAQIVPSMKRPWTHWRKAGLVVRAGSAPARITVPKAWRKRVAITWGNRPGVFSSLRLMGCPGAAGGNAFAGGFYLRSRSACVPLVFDVEGRRITVRFGLGRTCR
jgi:hypothetical protein